MTTITAEPFGVTRAGEEVTRYELRNRAGMRVRILSYGCTVQSIFVSDAAGQLRDVALGYDDLASYEAGSCYFGAVVGRYAIITIGWIQEPLKLLTVVLIMTQNLA